MLSAIEQTIFKKEIKKLSEEYSACKNEQLKQLIKEEIIELRSVLMVTFRKSHTIDLEKITFPTISGFYTISNTPFAFAQTFDH